MDKTISLLPFIESGKNGFLLDIPTFAHKTTTSLEDCPPFISKGQGQKYSILIAAGLKTRYSKPFKPLSLLVQRDNYPFPPDDLNPVTNSDLDRIWSETIRFYYSDKAVFHIPGEFDDHRDISPFAPLFFCKKEKKFFHPPCPECGLALTLCKNDRILKDSGLFQYTRSLKRYLYCPGCYDSGTEKYFYKFSSSAIDPASVKDRFDLIRGFTKLRARASGNYPCLDCPGHSDCYITGEKAISRIGFFSFYPFYMLFFDSAPIKAIDFMGILSGALPEELPNLPDESCTALSSYINQATECFFFKGEDRFFLEVLYLKLSLLEKIIQSVNQKIGKDISSFIGLSAQSIWITPSVQGSMLPFCWDFNLTIIDLISTPPEAPIISTLAERRDLDFIIGLWFFTFLVNKNQEPGQVYREIGKLGGIKPTENFYSEYDSLIQSFPALAVENIFWKPCGFCVPEKWKGLWLKTLSTGIELFQDNRKLIACIPQLLKQIKNLKHEIKEELFSSRTSNTITGILEQKSSKSDQSDSRTHQNRDLVSTVDKQAIAQILSSLKDKWSGPRPSDGNDDDVLETIVLSSYNDLPDQDLPADEITSQEIYTDGGSIESNPLSEFDELEKTILIQNSTQEPGSPGDFEDMEKTRIISTNASPTDQTEFFDADDLDKTLIIPNKSNGQKG